MRESPARKHTPNERNASGISSLKAASRRSASFFTAAQSAIRAHPATAAPNTGDAATTQPATSKARQAPRTSESKASDVEA